MMGITGDYWGLLMWLLMITGDITGDYWWLMLIDADSWWNSLWWSVTWLEHAQKLSHVRWWIALPRLMTPERIFQIQHQKLGLRTDRMKMGDTWYDGGTRKNWDGFFWWDINDFNNKNLGVSIWKSWEPFFKIPPVGPHFSYDLMAVEMGI